MDNKLELAKALLKENGYFVDNLWHTDDVKSRFECDDATAQKILYDALTNEATMEYIWFAIESIGNYEYKLTEV
jgi:hypothetical protein